MNKRRKIAFVINPISGSGKAVRSEALIKRKLNGSADYRIEVTKHAGDGTNIAKKAVEEGFDTVVAVGGDGTVNEVGRALVGTEVKLGIMPLGSGNGLARHMKIPLMANRALDVVLNGVETKIDSGLVNEEHYFSVAGVGFDAEVSREFAKTKNRGFFNYLRIILELGQKIREFDAKLSYNGQSEEVKIATITVANSSQYGNNAQIAPRADISDGKLDACLLVKMPFAKMLGFLIALVTGQLKNNGAYRSIQSDSFTLESQEEWAHIDGDPIKLGKKLNFKTIPNSLNLLTKN